jgi:DNA polymerase-4
MDKLVFHIDVNSAFLSWEAAYRLHIALERIDLREIPSAVGGDIKKRHGIILAKSIPAKKFNIKTGEPLVDALKKCPGLVVVPPRYSLYERCSNAFIKILKEYCPCVEQYSIDEAFCDFSGTNYIYEDGINLAYEIKDRIHEELGFTVNIGISTNKLLAKMASELKKPNMVHTIFPHEIKSKMWKLPVSDLFYVGRATTRKLNNLGIHTIGELANTDVSILKSHLKKHGELIHNFANGRDVTEVVGEPPKNKGYGNSTTTPYDIVSKEQAYTVLLSLAETVCTRLRIDHAVVKVVAIHIVDIDFNHSSHQTTLLTATNITNEIYKISCKLFDRLWDHKTPIRHLGIHTSKVEEDTGTRQLTIFDMTTPYEKLNKLDRAIDAIRNKYGADSVKRATFIDNPIYHMSGGIPPEKR